MSDPPPPGDNPPADAPVTTPTDRAVADAARAEAERVRLQDAIDLINVHYNQNGGPPPLQRLISPNRRLGNAPMLPPRVMGGGPVQGPAQGGGQALQPGLLQQLNMDNGRNVDGGVGRLHANSYPDANTKEGKYEIFTDLSEDLKNLAQYNHRKTKLRFRKCGGLTQGKNPLRTLSIECALLHAL